MALPQGLHRADVAERVDVIRVRPVAFDGRLMEVRIASQPSPGRSANEDFAFALPDLVGVLDGVSAPDPLDTGCRHGPSWYVRRLGAHIAAAHSQHDNAPLADLLGDAIAQVATYHSDTCDLQHPGTPASTVCLVRAGGKVLEYLVLCDSPLVVERADVVTVITDPRFAAAVTPLRAAALSGAHRIGSQEHAAGVRHMVTRQRALTNREDGYWIAAADPVAARHAVTGTLPMTGGNRVSRAALLTDGAAALCLFDGSTS
ncbi:hypothetical protein ACFO1B_36460 [Dactylosporangium siamense]|uniref:Uncharacterized protein n=1 Tax=Dactylosporangium siamense TaxID=685454 RepID=A0A919PPD7_9ACTN|nr:hypothetical protein [Dactylosporangium siamense]GIG46070.1 hypothetical protein Dsi01nite_041110 [Dactylosporangium siamense]